MCGGVLVHEEVRYRPAHSTFYANTGSPNSGPRACAMGTLWLSHASINISKQFPVLLLCLANLNWLRNKGVGSFSGGSNPPWRNTQFGIEIREASVLVRLFGLIHMYQLCKFQKTLNSLCHHHGGCYLLWGIVLCPSTTSHIGVTEYHL